MTERTRLVRHLTVVGWLLLGGQVGFVLFQLERVRSVDGTRFATAWDQRVEVLSFLVLPPNLGVLIAAGIVAAVATWGAGPQRDPWLTSLLRVVAAIAIALFFVGIAAIAEISTRDGQGSELDAVFLRLGGMSITLGVAWACRVADRLRDEDRG